MGRIQLDFDDGKNTEVAGLTNETKTEAVRRALLERRNRLCARTGKSSAHRTLRECLERSVWPLAPPAELGRSLSRDEEDQILGYGPEGY